jgi:ABC-2 type transport system permease protein
MQESSTLLYRICATNPFTHAVEMIRFALYGQANWAAAGWTLLAFAVFLAAALLGYDPARGLIRRSAN